MSRRFNGKLKNAGGVLGRRSQSAVVAIIAIVIVIALVASYGIVQMIERRAHDAAETLVSSVVDHIDAKMNEVRDVTRIAAQSADADLFNPEALEQLTRDFVAQNDFVYGSTVAFEPDVFPELGRCFAPYSWKTSDGEVHSRQLGTETDYYQEEWYAETKRTGREYWCEPYFDEGGAKITMCTFSIPLKNSHGALVAVMTADVGLEDLEEYISSISPYPESYIVLRSKGGQTLVNEELDTVVGNDTIIIKGITDIGWTVELSMPFNYLMHGDTEVFLIIGTILVITILFVFFLNRLITRLQERSNAEYINVIDAISTSFTSIHLLDLMTGEAYAFRDPENYNQVIDGLGENKNNFIEKLGKLIEYDGYAADRAMMHRETQPEIIRSRLASQDRYEVRFRKSSGDEIRWNEMHVFAMERGKDGAAIRAVIAFTDVNESVKMELENQATLEHALETAESANQAKTSFLFNMSHDIRTPMNAIIGFTNMAIKNIGDKERVLDCLGKMQAAGGLLLSLINDILDMSRIESGHITLDENEGDVYLSFANIESTMHEMAAAKNIDLSFEFGDITDRYVLVDFSRCIRIFVNIITNAIKYTNPGGCVKVRCEQTGREDGRGIYKYTVSDNGIGMSEEFQKRVFDEFAREETATVSGIQGTGLGLAVCRSFVAAMNGTIECESTQGEGSTFTVTLPLKIQESDLYTNPDSGLVLRSTDAGDAGTIDFNGRRVLLVEDNELNTEIAEDILSEEGMLVDSASDGSIAVKIMNEKGPDYYDFILMDIQMPIMNGYEATKLIREMYPKADIPIIALSANAFAEDKVKSLIAGMNDHVAKPINLDALKAALAKYL